MLLKLENELFCFVPLSGEILAMEISLKTEHLEPIKGGKVMTELATAHSLVFL